MQSNQFPSRDPSGPGLHPEVTLKNWLRRLRGAIGIGLTWAAAWFAAGMLVLLVVGFGAADVPFPLFFGFLGFLGGAAFSVILGIAGRRRRFDQMSLPGFATWGALGGGLLSLFAAAQGAELIVVAPVFAVAGAISAAGTLALARKGTQRALRDGRDDAEKLLP